MRVFIDRDSGARREGTSADSGRARSRGDLEEKLAAPRTAERDDVHTFAMWVLADNLPAVEEVRNVYVELLGGNVHGPADDIGERAVVRPAALGPGGAPGWGRSFAINRLGRPMTALRLSSCAVHAAVGWMRRCQSHYPRKAQKLRPRSV